MNTMAYIFEILDKDCKHYLYPFMIYTDLEYSSKNKRLHQGLDYIVYL